MLSQRDQAVLAKIGNLIKNSKGRVVDLLNKYNVAGKKVGNSENEVKISGYVNQGLIKGNPGFKSSLTAMLKENKSNAHGGGEEITVVQSDIDLLSEKGAGLQQGGQDAIALKIINDGIRKKDGISGIVERGTPFFTVAIWIGVAALIIIIIKNRNKILNQLKSLQ